MLLETLRSSSDPSLPKELGSDDMLLLEASRFLSELQEPRLEGREVSLLQLKLASLSMSIPLKLSGMLDK